MSRTVFLIVLVVGAVLAGSARAQGDALDVVATTTIVADVARNIGGDLVNVTSLLPPDTDTHAYQLSTNDVMRVAQADLLLVVGAEYEAFLGGLLENAGDVPIIEVSRGVPILPFASDGEIARDDNEPDGTMGFLGSGLPCDTVPHDEEAHETEATEHPDHAYGECDPHVWMNPENVAIWAQNIAEAFSIADPANEATYRANANAYAEQLVALDEELQAMVAELPEERRVLVTNHEVLAYFAAAYGFDVLGTVNNSLSTSAEPTPQQIAELVGQIAAAGVPAIFAEVSANSRLADVVAQEAGVQVVNTLYTEALSAEDGPAPTYIEFIRHNTRTIVDALR